MAVHPLARKEHHPVPGLGAEEVPFRVAVAAVQEERLARAWVGAAAAAQLVRPQASAAVAAAPQGHRLVPGCLSRALAGVGAALLERVSRWFQMP